MGRLSSKVAAAVTALCFTACLAPTASAALFSAYARSQSASVVDSDNDESGSTIGPSGPVSANAKTSVNNTFGSASGSVSADAASGAIKFNQRSNGLYAQTNNSWLIQDTLHLENPNAGANDVSNLTFTLSIHGSAGLQSGTEGNYGIAFDFMVSGNGIIGAIHDTPSWRDAAAGNCGASCNPFSSYSRVFTVGFRGNKQDLNIKLYGSSGSRNAILDFSNTARIALDLEDRITAFSAAANGRPGYLTSVPLPGGVLLLLSGFGGLSVFRRLGGIGQVAR